MSAHFSGENPYQKILEAYERGAPLHEDAADGDDLGFDMTEPPQTEQCDAPPEATTCEDEDEELDEEMPEA